MATKLEILMAEIRIALENLTDSHRELKDEVKENMATVEDVELLRGAMKQEVDQLTGIINGVKTLVAEADKKYVSIVTARWMLIVSLLILALALKVDLTQLIPTIFKVVTP